MCCAILPDRGSPSVQRIGSPRLVHMSSSDYVTSGGYDTLIQSNPYNDEMAGDGWKKQKPASGSLIVKKIKSKF
ncbi:unnamed protein product [Anisakis simplex]|uniref:Ovule protein n=1 Tax=Anisakis simplex TaxID=6269 RepID=A0A0M3K2K6_ANISI|nr:unnamed protein product [Anisakis simplex]